MKQHSDCAKKAFLEHSMHSELEHRFKNIDVICDHFFRCQSTIMSALKSTEHAEIESEDSFRKEFENYEFFIRGVLEETLQPTEDQMDQNTSLTTPSARAKLPELKLSICDGDIKNSLNYILA
ncbi:hypothetical protein HHI36_018134 [Cryptolaemus montrouzieri]|uniref:Uncharacterized protein n=1 Tax=Cryptolaemus montrouzieri TaxID=559131 RepID=A0ABD2NZ15_9CUCU